MRKRLPADVLDYFRKEGARGGTIAGKRMTAAERQARARKGSLAAKRKRDAQKTTK